MDTAKSYALEAPSHFLNPNKLTTEIPCHNQGLIEQMEVVTITRDITICKRHVIGEG